VSGTLGAFACAQEGLQGTAVLKEERLRAGGGGEQFGFSLKVAQVVDTSRKAFAGSTDFQVAALLELEVGVAPSGFNVWREGVARSGAYNTGP